VIQKNGKSYYTRFRAIYAEPECLRCHGDPADAPPKIMSRYKIQGNGYQNRIGEVIAVDAVYIPVDFALERIKKHAWVTFIMGAGLLLSLTVLFYALFNHTVITELKGLLADFAQIRKDSGDDGAKTVQPETETPDEIGRLKQAFEREAVALKNIHEKLAFSEAKYRRLFETSKDPIFIADMDSHIIDMNEAGMRLFEFADRSEALSIEMVDQLFWDAHEITELRNCLIKNGYTKDYEISMVNRHGKRLDVLVTANLRTNDQGEPVGFEGFIRDITAKKQFEKQLAQTKRLASVGQLAAGVAHEINNPLGVIKCYADLIKKSTSDNSQTAKDVKIIKKHTESCQKIVDDLLNFSRISVPQRKKICIHDGVREVLAIMNKQLTERRIEVECQFGTHVPSITADPEKLKQVCLNIIMNAAQSIETQGRITIETDFDHLKKIVNIRIADTGAGISAKNQEKIFDPFFTTKKAGQGTGLGLSISYAIVRDHGGAILVKSALRRGSEFIISLPADTS
jgi:PAS domain S-box-containing protein